ncbi:hypothetical protein ACIOWI_37270 [Streptomyces sp. NPDC087659]|uniref:hypothetical protein n=1 Tax=Streptomyces sp. NPDC087659 TaxID=3365801 RepID=UPI00382F7845
MMLISMCRRVLAVVVLAVLAPFMAATPASALPGEQPWEMYDGPGTTTASTPNAAHNILTGVTMTVWRGLTDDGIWYEARDSSGAKTPNLPSANSHTNYAPAIAPAGRGFVMVHTGTDGNLYYSVNADSSSPQNWTSWTPVKYTDASGTRNASSKDGPSIIEIDGNVTIAYHARSSSAIYTIDGTVSGSSVNWYNNVRMNVTSSYAPAIANYGGRLYVAYRADSGVGNGHVYWSHRTGQGTADWTNGTPVRSFGSQPGVGRPAIATHNATLDVATLTGTNTTGPHGILRIQWNGSSWGSWEPDPQGFQTASPVSMHAGLIGSSIVMLMRGLDENAIWEKTVSDIN